MQHQLKIKSSVLLFGLLSGISFSGEYAFSETLDWYGDALLRYENDHNSLELSRRERIRFTGHFGVRQQRNDSWFWDLRASTGLRDKQNVPAITLKQFTDQPLPDRTVYIDRVYGHYNIADIKLWLGKIPWVLERNTAIYWDPDLHPYGLALRKKINQLLTLDFSYIKPLDGQTATTGDLVYLSATFKYRFDELTLKISPWYASFNGEPGTRFTGRDTALDNRSLRFSATAIFNKYSFGVDYGYALNDFDGVGEFSDDKTAWVVQTVYGGLENPGDWELNVRRLYIERFGVIKEFAQNSTARIETSNYEGYEIRLRRKIADSWWLGTRFADTELITGNKERGRRFRIEAKYYYD